MTSRTLTEQGLNWLYDLVTGDEDARVCKDIPDEACVEQPRNFFAYLSANLCNKIADELVSARLTLPWLFSVLGVPAAFVGFLVPIREAGVLLPQLLVAAYVRNMRLRKTVWLAGALSSALALALMALAAGQSAGIAAGWLLLACLVLYSLARGLCSVTAKDVLGKTVSKTRRGRLMGYSAALAGVATVMIGLFLQGEFTGDRTVLVWFVVGAAVLWIMAAASIAAIAEPAGATEGGGNAIAEALRSLRLLVDDKPFQHYVLSRILLLSVALVVPFYVLLVQQLQAGQLALLGWLIIANGLASSISAPLVGRWADRSSRKVMAAGAALAGGVGLATWCAAALYGETSWGTPAVAVVFFLVTLAHSAVRLGRKVYLVDMATQENRAQYVAVSNTVIGLAMLGGGLIGVLADVADVQTVILLLSLVALAAALYILRLPDVSG